MIIDIFTSLAANSVPYANLLYHNLRHKASGSNTLRFHAVTTEFHVEDEEDMEGWEIVARVYPGKKDRGSRRHSLALNEIINHIPENSDMLIITDCDMVMLAKDWDVQLRESHERREIPFFGTLKHDGSLRMFFLSCYPTDRYISLQPDFRPGTPHDRSSRIFTITTEAERDTWNLKIGKQIVMDTGWTLSEQIHDTFGPKAWMGMHCDEAGHYYGEFIYHIGGSAKRYYHSGDILDIISPLQKKYTILPASQYQRLKPKP